MPSTWSAAKRAYPDIREFRERSAAGRLRSSFLDELLQDARRQDSTHILQ